jgi:inner membrane protein
MTDEKVSWLDRLNNWAKRSVMLKLFIIGILILLLLIPVSMVQSLIYERQQLRNDAQREISGKWGNEQFIGGPVLSVPYDAVTKNSKGEQVTEIRYAHFLPDELKISGELLPEKRSRGIYVAMLYNAQLNISGRFNALNLSGLMIQPAAIHFEDAFLSFGISDMRGIKRDIGLTFAGQTYAFESGIPVHDILSSGVSVSVKVLPEQGGTFALNLNLNGSGQIYFLPFGKKTSVQLASTWPSPSFDGSFLPDVREVNEQGFSASWNVLELNRNYPQQGLGAFITGMQPHEVSSDADQSSGRYASFGVKLMLPVDEYQKNNRSAKYSVMFVFLTFLTLFFVELLHKKQIHPLQYLLVGFAITLFYVLLLSFSEHISFDKSYLIACSSIVALLTYYVWHMVQSAKTTMLVSSVFMILYGFFYSLLQLEDYALLFGSLGLLLILGVVMYLSRRLSWSLSAES